MITGEIKNKVDQIWNAFWSGGVSNPLSVIEQITYLLFAKRLDELHTAKGAQANLLSEDIRDPIFYEKKNGTVGRNLSLCSFLLFFCARR